MSNPTTKKTSRKLTLSLQTVHVMSSRSHDNFAPTATCIGCITADCGSVTLFMKK